MDLVSQLNDFYYKYEHWIKDKLSEEEITSYHKEKISKGQIITVSVGELLIGYIEFSVDHGCCFINNLFILPDYRGSKAMRMLKNRVFELCNTAKVYVGERNKNNMKFPEVQIRSKHGIR